MCNPQGLHIVPSVACQFKNQIVLSLVDFELEERVLSVVFQKRKKRMDKDFLPQVVGCKTS
jgi:hypothetical protein